MSDEFFGNEKNNEEITNRNMDETTGTDESSADSTIQEPLMNNKEEAYSAIQEPLTNNKEEAYSALQEPLTNNQEETDSVYRLSKPVQGTYSFWAEQITGTGSTQNYEDFQQFKENKGYDKYSSNDTRQFVNNGQSGGNNKSGSNKSDNKVLRKIGKLAVTAVAFGLIAGLSFIGFNTVYYKINPNAEPIYMSFSGSEGFTLSNKNEGPLLSTTAVTDGKITQKTDVTDVIEKTMPSIVQITTTYSQTYNDWFGQQYDEESEGGGSGIIVGKNNKELLIATNNHVVDGADPITVKFIDGTEAKAIIKGTDSVADLAVISIDLSKIKASTLGTIQIAKLGDSDAIKVGEMAVAIGNALGYGQSTTVGYISAKDREVQVDDKKMVLLQTDAAINPGNSGGALINLNGDVIGINTVKYASSEVEGMGFAIPISRANPIIDELMSREVLTDNEKGYLGVVIQDVTEEISEMYNWPIGVFVKKAIEGNSASNAGIVAGDIITKVNDTEITAGTQLKEKVNSYRVGTKINITVKRNVNGKFEEKTFEVTLTGTPETDSN